ncbi:hypothetical protein ABPG75_006555 [Micractinium tetrahymenae]
MPALPASSPPLPPAFLPAFACPLPGLPDQPFNIPQPQNRVKEKMEWKDGTRVKALSTTAALCREVAALRRPGGVHARRDCLRRCPVERFFGSEHCAGVSAKPSPLPLLSAAMASAKQRQKQLAELRAAFNLADKDGSGSIDLQELRQVLRALGQFPTPVELADLMPRMDANKNGVASPCSAFSALCTLC